MIDVLVELQYFLILPIDRIQTIIIRNHSQQLEERDNEMHRSAHVFNRWTYGFIFIFNGIDHITTPDGLVAAL